MRTIVVGHTGQDGRLLWQQLLARGDTLLGISSTDLRTSGTDWNDAVDVTDAAQVLRLIETFRPDQIYYLAAHHHSSQDRIEDETALWASSLALHVTGFRHVLEAVRRSGLPARTFYASSSRVFGQATESPQTEFTPLRPACVYGLTKTMGMQCAGYYRRQHGVFAACGILYNHESAWRDERFVSQRIVQGLVAVSAGRQRELELGDLSIRVDWGYAPDYTQAMQQILALPEPEDFVIATGETHAIRDWVEIAADALGLRWQSCVRENGGLLRRASQQLCGDASKLRAATGWRPATSFAAMVREMVRAAERQAD